MPPTEFSSVSAVLSECLYTVAMIHPLKSLSEMAARRVGLFLVSNNNNLKYLGKHFQQPLDDFFINHFILVAFYS